MAQNEYRRLVELLVNLYIVSPEKERLAKSVERSLHKAYVSARHGSSPSWEAAFIGRSGIRNVRVPE